MNSAKVECQACGQRNLHRILNLGKIPLANALLSEKLADSSFSYPLELGFCRQCTLVQLMHLVPPQKMFSEYLYFSSYSDTWLDHAREMAEALMKRFHLNSDCKVLEVGSNDGYLLQYFQQRAIRILGIEPAQNIVREARRRGIPTFYGYFSKDTALEITQSLGPADLLIGNNVLAHVPKIRDFFLAVRSCLKPGGVAVFEFPYLHDMLEKGEFDTIYHEHVFYFSLTAIRKLAERENFVVFDVERYPIHGGSLRVFLEPQLTYPVSSGVQDLLSQEEKYGFLTPEVYSGFQKRVVSMKEDFFSLLSQIKSRSKRIAAYGAPAKATILLNYCNIGTDFLDYTVDRNPQKQGRYIPGKQIPIFSPEKIKETKPDYLVILPWNLKEEVMQQMALIREWGGKFIVPIPKLEVLP